MCCGKGTLLVLSWLVVMLTACPARAAGKDDVVLLSLEWPPYTSLKLPGNGTVAQHVKDVYASLGQDTRIGFFSWRRAMRLPYTDHRFTGFFPAYPTLERKRVCHLSDPIGMSPLGIAQSRKHPIQWTRVEDLVNYRMGVVEAYANEDTFDQLVQQGKIVTISSPSDADNLLNLARGKVDAAVVDTHVFEWLLKNEPRLKPYRSQLEVHPRLLVTWPLFICFRRDNEGAAMRDHFNKGLAALNEKSTGADLPSPPDSARKPARSKPSPAR